MGGSGAADMVGSFPLALRHCTTRNHIPDFTSANQSAMSRSSHFTRSAVTAIKLVLPVWYVNAAKVETALGANTTFTAAIEYPVGTFKQVTFSGAVSGVGTAGTNFITDWIPIAIPNFTEFYARIKQQCTAGCLAFQYYAAKTGDGFVSHATSTPDLTMGGAVTQATSVMYMPAAIIAMTTEGAVWLPGDSIQAGRGESADATGDQGLFARAIGPRMAYINGGVSGDQAVKYVASHARREELAQYCTSVGCNFGINDITAGSQTAANVIASHNTIAGYNTTKPYYVSTLLPQTTSTDGWVTAGINQTVGAFESTRAGYNALLRNGGVTAAAGIFCPCAVAEDTFLGGKWRALIGALGGGTANYTPDGVHMNLTSALHCKAMNCINAAVFRR